MDGLIHIVRFAGREALRAKLAGLLLAAVVPLAGCGSDKETASGDPYSPPCTDPSLPLECAATDRLPNATCLPGGSVCATATECAGQVFACENPGQYVDCPSEVCVDSAECRWFLEDSSCGVCLENKCCMSAAACAADPDCAGCYATGCDPATSSRWRAVRECALAYCPVCPRL